MSLGSVQIWEMVHRAQTEAMERLLRAWDREIEAEFERLRERAQRQHQQQLREGAEARRKLLEEMGEAALNASVAAYLTGLAETAEANDTSAVTASVGLPTSAITELAPLLARVQDEVREGKMDSPLLEAQRSVATAMDRGLIPSPADLQSLLLAAGQTQQAKAFGELAERLRADSSFRNPAIQYRSTHDRISALSDEVKLLKGIGSENLVRLITEPQSLAKVSLGSTPQTASPLDRALDILQRRS